MRPQQFTLVVLVWLLLVGAVFAVGWWLTEPAGRSQVEGTVPRAQAIETLPPPSNPAEPRPVRLFAVGDLMLGRNVERVAAQHGYPWLFERFRSQWADYDAVFGNLEGPIVRRHRLTPTGSFSFSFPSSTAPVLRDVGFTVLALGNNHGLDQGEAGFAQTKEFLDAAGIRSAGHPRDIADAHAATWEVRGVPITLLSYNATWPQFSLAAASAQVERAASSTAAFVIVSVHWGEEYVQQASARQRKIGHALVDAGADLVIGHHPHVEQNLERYRDRLIFYSLGNFIFDQYFSRETQEGLAFGLEITPDRLRVRLVPFASVRSQPQPLADERRDARLAALAASSSPELSASIRRGTIELPR